VLHGSFSYLLQNEDGQVLTTHSISAGLDYPGVGPEHSHLKETGRATYVSVNDACALRGLQALSQSEGIIPALEPAHALGYLVEQGEQGNIAAGSLIILNLSGRGDKDMPTVAKALDLSM
jgi:tryptophan synthase beta chain